MAAEEAEPPIGSSSENSSHHQRDPTAATDDDEEDVEKLEREVKEMAEKIFHFRRTVLQLAIEALQSSMRAQRPHLCSQLCLGLEDVEGGEPEGRGEDDNAAGTSGGSSTLEMDQETMEKLQLFQTKTSRIVEVLPNLVKRMEKCIARIDRVCQHNVNIHPIFKKSRKL